MEECGQVRLELISREDEQGHRFLELPKELLVGGSTRSKLLLGKIDGCRGIISSGVADELNKLQPKQGKVQVGITVQDLSNFVSQGPTKVGCVAEKLMYG